MKYFIIFALLLPLFNYSQLLPSRWDELTASDWELALKESNYTCILPIGILEKHGPHGPLGSDLIRVREWAKRATKEEYAVVFPDYFYGQINEAKHEYGTFSLPSKLTMELLEATVAEIGRNGFKRIIIINGHGGNPQMIRYFIQNQLESKRNYAVYFFEANFPPEVTKKINEMRQSDPSTDMHGGEKETSVLLYIKPEVVKKDRATQESGADQKRHYLPSNLYTGIWWYARFPNHYAGQGEVATPKLGKIITDNVVRSLVESIKAVKADQTTLKLQEAYYNEIKK